MPQAGMASFDLCFAIAHARFILHASMKLACLLACWLIPISRFRVVFYGNQGTRYIYCNMYPVKETCVPHRLHVDLAKVYILICRSTNIDCKI